MDKDRFTELVQRAVESLPEEYAVRLDNVDVVVEDLPARGQLTRAQLKRGETLLGLYEGVPLTERSASYGLVPPDKITIFQKPIEAACRSGSEVEAQIRKTVMHEIAHFFGISDSRLEELGKD